MSDNGLAPNRRQAIYTSLGLNWLRRKHRQTHVYVDWLYIMVCNFYRCYIVTMKLLSTSQTIASACGCNQSVCNELSFRCMYWTHFPLMTLYDVIALSPYSLKRHHLTGTGIRIIYLRRSTDRLMFIMGILIPIRRRHLATRSPWSTTVRVMSCCPTPQSYYRN